MTESLSSDLESLDFLFQKKSSIRAQISPHAAFNPASAVAGAEGFRSQITPDQKPQKRKIYFQLLAPPFFIVAPLLKPNL
jgi:hypothetical protein